ncbi:MAG: ribonuclease HI [Treponema sp.]|jgi:ribonuclease HI|nr:ribonuclease HI [Treponema sp.]
MLHIYTDGGCSGNPGPGGWAFIILRDEVLIAENWGVDKSTTNNRMELKAVISALEALPSVAEETSIEDVTVYTDSQYIQKGMTIWMKDWKIRGWKTSDKKPVKNQDLWQRLDTLAAGLPISWTWVRGHAGDEYNERCDKLTQKAIASL